jgi:glycosyltransferase involved in cell wall biosynthesis
MNAVPRVDIVNFNFFDWDGEKLFTGGAERYVAELAQLVQRLGVPARIVQNARRSFVRDYKGTPVVGVPAAPALDLRAMPAGFRDAVRDASLVIASPVELALGLDLEAPVIGINHGIYWDRPELWFEAHDYTRERWMIDAVRACLACVCVDTNFYNWVRCLDAGAATRLRCIPNFVDLDCFKPVDKRFDQPALEVLFPRRLCTERGFRDVVEAFDRLLPRHPGLSLHLCGSGPEEDEAIAASFIKRHAGRVRRSELAMDAMAEAYAASHIVLVPTRFAEGTSLSCLEAMATNNAIVATPVGGLGNLVVDGYNGVVVLPGASGIVQAIDRLVADRVLLARLARTAIDIAPAFGKDRWLARWRTLLQHAAPSLFAPAEWSAVDVYRGSPWRYGFWAEREALRREKDALDAALAKARSETTEARAAWAQSEERLMWVQSELNGIKTSTGWALLQLLYRIRFSLFPRGSARESAARWLMRRLRSARASWRSRGHDAAADSASSPGAEATSGSTVRTEYAILCLPILEWAFRFQRPQQLARCLAHNGHEIVFARHTFGDALSARAIEPGIEEIELPGTVGANPYRDRMSEADAERMADALLEHFGRRGFGRFVCVVQLPFWAPLAFALRVRTGCDVVYDCMDLHAGFSSNAEQALGDEDTLLRDADLVVCSSQRLIDHAVPHARRIALVRNGVDYEHFAGVPDRAHSAPAAPTVGYYGAIADWFDGALVAGIARLRPQWRIVLIGSTWSADLSALQGASNVELLGEKPYAELPALIADWDCCFIPFRHTPLTDATNPVKVYEMLAAGKPVVGVRLPELLPIAEAGLIALAEGAEAFVSVVEAQVAANAPGASVARRAYGAANTWEVRARALEAEIEAIQPQVSIIVVTFGNRTLNELCLGSVFGDTDYREFEVIVVDNASNDGTVEMLRELAAREPRLRVIENADNRGFAAANNQGAAIARGRYLCFLNNDTVVHGRWLATLVGHLRRHAHLGLVGPVTNAIGNEAKIAVGYTDLADMPRWADAHCATNRGALSDISMLAFFCVVVPRFVWQQVGPLDARFAGGMFEDDDYNRRVRAAGFDVKLARDAFVHHWQMASFKLLGHEEYLRLYRENEARYADKWRDVAEPAADPLAGLKRRAQTAPRTVIFAPSVGWAIALAQRPHHVARVLAEDGCVVVFDCTNAADAVDTVREVEPRLFLYKGPPQALSGLPRVTLWTFSYNYDYRDAFPPGTAVIYDWIDDLSVFPYAPAQVAALHARALRGADVVVAVARRLHEQATVSRPDALYVPNAVEQGHFDMAPDPNPALDDVAFRAILSAGRPIAGYYGALARWFDYELVAETARRRPDWSFVLIGPDHDGSLGRAKLDRVPNIVWLGPKSYTSLPGYLHRFDVATIPFAINDITLATSPLKLFEYFAAGKPVIATPMPECAAFDVVRIVRDAEEFAAGLDAARLQGNDADFRRRVRAIADANTWRARARETMEAVGRAREPSPPAALAHKTFLRGTCNVCGNETRFFRDDPSLDRESLTCEHCRTTSRYRSIARGILDAIKSRTGVGAAAVDELPLHADVPSFRILDTQAPFFFEPCAYPLPDILRRRDWIDVTVSSYRPDRRAGEMLAPGVVNQNLEQLTFADGTFDIVVTSDVMEHVRLDDRAHAEIARVLKPGGVYVFTVPHFRDRRDTLERVRVHDPADPARDEFLTTPEYHGDANAADGRGALSYRSYGTVLDEELAALGFDVRYTFAADDLHGIRNTELFYCVKRGTPG